MAKPTNLPKGLTEGRPRQGWNPGGTKKVDPKNRKKFLPAEHWIEDSKTYKQDETAVSKLVKQQDKLEQHHNTKTPKE